MSVLLPMLVEETGLSALDLHAIISDAPSRYKVYQIAKRTGGKRIIAQPAREVKVLQYALIKHVLNRLPIHSAATAYQSGSSIRANAERHAGIGPILKYDFKDFFPSLRASDWGQYCRDNSVFEAKIDVWISSQIMFRRASRGAILRLAIGAPSSPQLSNILMSSFDEKLSAAVAPEKVNYTRYADDLTFSAPRTGFLNVVDRRLRALIREFDSPRLTINEKKTVLATNKYRRVVTGLVLSNDGSVSLGRDRKRLIRSMVHHALVGKLSHPEIVKLSGMLAFVQDVEPAFLERLREAYGDEVFIRIRASKKLKWGERERGDNQ
jgi:RNA-directed DNA polymerase